MSKKEFEPKIKLVEFSSENPWAVNLRERTELEIAKDKYRIKYEEKIDSIISLLNELKRAL